MIQKYFNCLAIVCVCLFFSTAQGQHKVFRFSENTQEGDYLPHSIVIQYKESSSQKSGLLPLPMATQAGLFEKIKVKNQQPFSSNFIQKLKNKTDKPLGEKSKKLLLTHTLEIDPSISIEDAINTLLQDPAIEYAEPIYINYKPLFVPNDPLMPTNKQYHLSKIKAFEAWDIAQGDPNMIIGITDNGFSVTNTDLANNYKSPSVSNPNNDVADNDNNVSSSSTHGTLVSLCAAAVPNNGIGTAGTGYHCKFLPVKVAKNTNVQSYTSGYDGILYAAEEGAKVINMSWGRTGVFSHSENDFLEAVVEVFDVVLVAAAGNEGNTNYYYPASYDIVLSVGATNSTDAKAGLSNYNNKIDIMAPGEGIVVDNTVGGVSGTSYAAPLVSGAVALIWDYYKDQGMNLTAEQVVARLKATTDNIDGLNPSYKGKLGTGRLNMYRALTEPFKAIQVIDYAFEKAERDNHYIFRGKTTQMYVFLKNHLNALSNLQATLATTSPYISITDNQSVLGAVNANTFVDNSTNDPFIITINDNTPANTEVTFVLNYTDGAYTYSEELNVIVNPGIIDINNIAFNVNDKGQLAVYHQEKPILSGLRYDDGYDNTDDIILKDAGLMIAANANQVSDAVRSSLNNKDSDFNMSSPFSYQLRADGNFLQTESIYEDQTNNAQRIGLEVTQRTFAWDSTGITKSVVVEYRIKNINFNGQTLENIYAGVFTDWNLLDKTQNIADFDKSNLLSYTQYDDGLNSLYAGVQLLTLESDTSYYAFNLSAVGDINIQDGFSNSEKFESFTSKKATQGTTKKDVANVIGTKIRSLSLGKSVYVSFAFVVGFSLQDLKNNAQNIKNKYVQTRKSPTPSISTIQACKSEDIIIQPSGGTNFAFYTTDPNVVGTTPAHVGNSIVLNNIRSNQTLYIANVDSVYTSDFVLVPINVVNLETDFTSGASTVNVAINNSLNLQSTSTNASQLEWEISLSGGTPNQDIQFLNGTNANSANPSISFNKLGLYKVKLLTQSIEGCKDSLSKDITVLQDVTTPLDDLFKTQIKVYPNPFTQNIQIVLPENISDKVKISLTDNLGKEIYQKETVLFQKEELISLQNAKTGIYFLKIQTSQGTVNYKLVKL
jgi:serine protease